MLGRNMGLKGLLKAFGNRIFVGYRGKIILTSTTKPGVFDIWSLRDYRNKTGAKEIILFYTEEPTQEVLKEASASQINLIKAEGKVKEEMEKVKKELENKGEKVVILRLEDIVPRSMFDDVL